MWNAKLSTFIITKSCTILDNSICQGKYTIKHCVCQGWKVVELVRNASLHMIGL